MPDRINHSGRKRFDAQLLRGASDVAADIAYQMSLIEIGREHFNTQLTRQSGIGEQHRRADGARSFESLCRRHAEITPRYMLELARGYCEGSMQLTQRRIRGTTKPAGNDFNHRNMIRARSKSGICDHCSALCAQLGKVDPARAAFRRCGLKHGNLLRREKPFGVY